MKTLISMTDFVLESISKFNTYELEENLSSIIKYANFLKQPLNLGMFVPCDDNLNILEEPKIEDYFDDGFNFEFNQKHFKEVVLKEYYKAKEKVLFEGFEIFKGTIYMCSVPILKVKDLYQTTIECLIHYEPILTESAIKQIGL